MRVWKLLFSEDMCLDNHSTAANTEIGAVSNICGMVVVGLRALRVPNAVQRDPDTAVHPQCSLTP